VLLLGVHDGVTINYSHEVLPLYPSLLVGYVWWIRFVHYVLDKCKKYAMKE
jgi:hypothetical protein